MNEGKGRCRLGDDLVEKATVETRFGANYGLHGGKLLEMTANATLTYPESINLGKPLGSAIPYL